MKTGLLEPLTSVVLQDDELLYNLKTKAHGHGGEHINPYVIEPLTDVNGSATDFIIAVNHVNNIYFRNSSYTNTTNEASYCGANGYFSATKFLSSTGASGGFSFINDGNADTGMFSDSDGVLIFKTNAMYLFGTAANLLDTTSNPAAHMRFMGNIYANGDIYTKGSISADSNIYCQSGMMFSNNLLAQNYLAVGVASGTQYQSSVANISNTIQLLSNSALGGAYEKHTSILFGAGLTSTDGWFGGAELYIRGANGWGSFDANNYLTIRKSGLFQYGNLQLATRLFVTGSSNGGKVLIVSDDGSSVTWVPKALIVGSGAIAKSSPITVTNSESGSIVGLDYKSTHFAIESDKLVLANVNSSNSGKYLKVVQSGSAYDVSWTNIADDLASQMTSYGITGNGTIGNPLAIIGVQGSTNQNKYLRIANGGSGIEWKSANDIVVDGLTPTPPITLVNGVISIPAATASVDGYLSSTKWDNFNSAYLATQAATNANAYSAIVKRDASGGFSAGAVLASSLWTTGSYGGGLALIDNQCVKPDLTPLTNKTFELKTLFLNVAKYFDLEFSTGRYGISNIPVFKIRNTLDSNYEETTTATALIRKSDGNWNQLEIVGHTHTLSNITDAKSMASQAANAVAITGGSIAGITDLAIADGGTGASDASTARTNLGLGTVSTKAVPTGIGSYVTWSSDTFGLSNPVTSISVSAPLTGGPTITTTGTIGIQVANSSQGGYLSSTDWTTFNGKSNLTLGTTSTTAYRGDYGDAAYAAAVTNATDLNTASTIVKRDASGNFSAGTITASLNGNASTVTNGVYTTGSYSNPSWITALAYSKLTGAPTLGTIAAKDLPTGSGSYVTWNGSTFGLGTPSGGTTYTAGTGISIVGSTISCTVVDTNTTYTAGTGISINGSNQISCTVVDTNTTYSFDTTASLLNLKDSSNTSLFNFNPAQFSISGKQISITNYDTFGGGKMDIWQFITSPLPTTGINSNYTMTKQCMNAGDYGTMEYTLTAPNNVAYIIMTDPPDTSWLANYTYYMNLPDNPGEDGSFWPNGSVTLVTLKNTRSDIPLGQCIIRTSGGLSKFHKIEAGQSILTALGSSAAHCHGAYITCGNRDTPVKIDAIELGVFKSQAITSFYISVMFNKYFIFFPDYADRLFSYGSSMTALYTMGGYFTEYA